jgi:glycine C-acetyltransferase
MAQSFRHFAGQGTGIRAFHGELTRNIPLFLAALAEAPFEPTWDEGNHNNAAESHAMLRPVASNSTAQTACTVSESGVLDGLSVQLFSSGSEAWPISAAGTAASMKARLNFATQDYLGLAAHPAIRAAALSALGQHRLGAPGSAVHPGLTAPVVTLETRIGRFLGLAATAFPSGTEAIRTTLGSILRPSDDVIVDAGAHPAVFETVQTVLARLHRSPGGSLNGIERRLRRLTRQIRKGRIFVAVSAVSACGSEVTDLAELSQLARSYGATLVVDVSHDLGCMGQDGGGVMEIQNCAGRIDVVIGSFAKCFGSSGGFAAFRDPAFQDTLRQSQWRTTALSPVNASAILAALDLVEGPEGRRRRRRLHGNALRLRNHLMADGIRIMGQASPFVILRLPPMTALPRTALLESAGPRVTLLRAPAVPSHSPRWRIQLNADHGAADIDDLAELVRDVTRTFDRQPRALRQSESLAQR